MSARSSIAETVRRLLGSRIAEVCEAIKNDQCETSGWGVPFHLLTAMGSPAGLNPMATTRKGWTNAELADLLSRAAASLEALLVGDKDTQAEDDGGLETALLLYVRPGLALPEREWRVGPPWSVLESMWAEIDRAQSAVGRIDLLGHPELDWAGNGFLLNERCLMTTRRIAETFLEYRDHAWRFRYGVSAWLDRRTAPAPAASARQRIRGVIGVSDDSDVALLEAEPVENQVVNSLCAWGLALEPGQRRPVYLVGWPVYDSRRASPLLVSLLDAGGGKRVYPGELCPPSDGQGGFIRHDCGTQEGVPGGALIDLATHHVLGIQLGGRWLQDTSAIPMWHFRNDPMFREAGVIFSQAAPEEIRGVCGQVEDLSRSEYWHELRMLIDELRDREASSGSSRPANSCQPEPRLAAPGEP
jgi:hypothetical protein